MSLNGLLPLWVEKGYATLWDHYNSGKFRLDDAIKILGEVEHDTPEKVPVLLSRLRKAGMLTVTSDTTDARKKIYTLVSKDARVTEIFDLNNNTLTRGDLEALLKRAADIIRTRVDYKFILLPLFLKRISDKWELEYEAAKEEALQDGYTELEAKVEAKRAMYHDFDLPEDYLWENLRAEVNKLPEVFSKALKEIAERNPELRDVLDTVDFIEFAKSQENGEILRQLIELFSEKKLHHVSPDVLGDAYEWILRYFAPQKAKEGEVYTPREVIRLLIEILDPKPGESVYDPASASNGMLIASYTHVKQQFGPEAVKQIFLYGQEANAKTLAYGRMNMYIHDIRNVQLAYGDTLLYPKFKDGEAIRQFDVVVANPPWNQDMYDENQLKKGEFWKQRFSYGFPNRQSADWAWIQHMLASAKSGNGRVGVVIDNGCLFRSGKEKAIRQQILEADLLECIILTPEKLFYNTGAPGALLFFSKNKRDEHRGKVLIINAALEFGKHPDVRKLNIITDKNIGTIVGVANSWEKIEGFSRVVSLAEIEKNDFNLNVTLYVSPQKDVEEVDIPATWAAIRHEEMELLAIDEQIAGHLKEIGYGGSV
ncbi:class I SAM-dependent DNA methyltransferase [uncultured Methanoregula sp.]|uniref:class I SAM-dependent DNA methyltransferase n=1 Tax=uncultured Methanoregula sp. TaxID=1005933 RepID=UPI002AAA8C59|nr:class I SAM-dependent DNA methyltransferase [uncultured Methanoregula sp.]